MEKEEREPKSMNFSEFCRAIENPEFHKNRHPSEKDVAAFAINPDALLYRMPDGPVVGRFVAAHLHFCKNCKGIADTIAKEYLARRSEFEI